VNCSIRGEGAALCRLRPTSMSVSTPCMHSFTPGTISSRSECKLCWLHRFQSLFNARTTPSRERHALTCRWVFFSPLVSRLSRFDSLWYAKVGIRSRRRVGVAKNRQAGGRLPCFFSKVTNLCRSCRSRTPNMAIQSIK